MIQLQVIVLNLFTTDFDIKLEKSTKTFRKGTCCLYSFLTDEEKSKIPDFILDVEYENLVKNKENEIKKILNFCDLQWDDKCLNPEKNSKTPIKTVSVTQARQPIYKSSLNSNINFDKYLSEMFNILK